MAEILLGGKRLAELKVAELKTELDKRSLSKKGVKAVLVSRLRSAILKEELTQQSEEPTTGEECSSSQAEMSQTEDEAAPIVEGGEPAGEIPSAEGEVPTAEQMKEEPGSATFDPASSDHSTIDVEATSPDFDNSLITSHDGHVTQEMELTTPLSPGSELNLSLEESVNDAESTEEQNNEKDVEMAETKEEERGEQSAAAKIAPSYLPGHEEELLYEGDVEHEAPPTTADAPPTLTEAPPPDGQGEDAGGFIVDLHVTSTDLDGPKREAKASAPKEDAATTSSTPTVERPADCHLWVSGLVATVRALDLQTLFSPFGQVISAKVVAKARSRASSRFGYVTMATAEQAKRSIKELSGTELKGNKITVAVAKSKPPLSKPVATPTSPEPIKALMDVHLPKDGDLKETSSAAGKGSQSSADRRSSTGKPKQSTHSPRGERSAPRRATGRRSPPSGSVLRGTSHRRSSPGPFLRRGSPPPRGRSPPRSAGRLGPVRRRSRSPPPRRVVSHVGPRGDARQDILRRAMARRVSGGGGDPFLSERERLAERRVAAARDRHHEMAVRRQIEVEHVRREEAMLRRVQEREAREREVVERQLAEQARLYKERERELRERELRERQRRELLERELKEKESRERELREREKRLKEQHERELREKEVKAQREREARERELRAQVERERELRDRERHLREEAERDRRAQQEEAARQLREQQRAREEAARMREEQEVRAREEQERRERERKEQERSKMKRDREDIQSSSSSSRLGKRPYSDGGGAGGYESVKRQAVHAIQRSSDSFGSNSSNVFGRLDQHNLQKHAEGSAIPSLMTGQHGNSFRRDGDSSASLQYGVARHSTGGGYHPLGGGGFMAAAGGGRERPGGGGGESVHYPLQLAGARSSTQEMFAKALTSGGALSSQSRMKTEPMARINPEMISAATQALENIRKARAGQSAVGPHLHQQLSAAGFLPHRQPPAFPAGAAGDSKKSEEERFNRRLGSRQGGSSSSSSHHGASFSQRQPYKRL